MKKILLLILILMSAILQAQNLSELAEMFNSGQQKEAMAKINSIIQQEPKNQMALVLRCQFNAKLNNLDAMIIDLNTLSEADPENITVYLQRAAVYKYQKKFNKAIADYRKASKLDPKNIEYNLQILSIFVQGERNITSGIAEASRIIHAFPNHKPSYYTRGSLWAMLGDMNNAYHDLLTITKMDQKSIDAYNALAWWMSTYPKEEYRNGAKSVEYALIACENSNWKDPRVIDTLAAAYAEVGNFQHANELITLALKLVKPNSSDEKELKKHKVLFEEKKQIREFPNF